MIGNRFYTWFKNYYQWVGGAFSETLLLPLVRATAGLRAGAIRYDQTTNTVETYDGTNWNPIPSASGFVPNSRTITINGTTFDLSTNRIYTIPTHDAVTLGTANGLALNNQQLSLALAASGTTGALSAADWASFNAKQGAISLTTTGNSGASTFAGNVLNIPNYTISGLGGVPTSRNLSINGTQLDLSADRSWNVGTVTSVGLSMPAAFTVSGSPVTGSGTLSVTGAGLATQYVRGDGTLANFPTTQGGGSSVSYYLNGSVNQGTFGGSTYYEMNRTPVLGAGTNFSRNTDGYIASFITDANDPALTEIPGGNFNLELYFSASSGGGTPTFYVELYKYDGTTFTLIASNSTSPDTIVGSAKDAYFTALAVPQTTLAITDRLAIRIYVSVAGRTITLHTEDQNLCQVITTFSTGINTINGLTKQVQFLTTGTSGTDFNINSTNSTHTFNIPTASATNRGALSSSDWTTFNNKVSTSRQLTINGTAFDLSADRSWSVGTVTSVGLNTGSAGTDINVSGSPVSVSGNITLNIPTASATNRGALSATDWAIFNAKQNALTLTTTGNSGASTLIGSTLNVPEYTISGLGGVPTSRTLTINGTAFDLSANRSWSVGTVTSVGLTSSTSGVTITDSPVTVSGSIGIAIATANGSQQGLLSSTDWATFNNKQNTLSLTTNGTSGAATLIGATLNVPQYQAQGNYITSLTGEATASGPGAASVTLSTTAVTGKLLTGLNLSGGGTIAATDSILTAFGKVQNQISAMMGGVTFQGVWNASTNTPTLTSSTGTKGHYYIVDVSGTTNLNGITDWRVGDWAIFNGSTWDKVDNTDAVSSVNGFTGAVSLTTSHIAEGTNLYYTDTRARNAISLTTTGNSGAATYTAGVFNVPQYTLSGLGGVPTTRQLTINGTAFDLSADRSWNVGTVTSVGLNSTTSGVTITNTPVTGSGALTINIATASGSQQGLLSSTDWTTFNNKQNALTNPVTGTGTTGQVAYFNGTTSITGESNLFWDASNDRLGIGINTPSVIQHLYAGLSGSALFYTRYTSVDGADIRFGKNFGATDTNNAILGTWSNNAIDFYTNSTLAARLDASGRLGIGTATPTERLDVRGNIYTNGTNTNIYLDNGGVGGASLKIGVTGTTETYINSLGDDPLILLTNNTERMRITSGGDVGIGTNNPAGQFNVNASSGADVVLSRTTGATSGVLGTIRFGNTNIDSNMSAISAEQDGATNAANLIFSTQASGGATTERMRITSGGNVGIGTTSPNLAMANIGLSVNSSDYSVFELNQNNARAFYIYSNSSSSFIGTFGAAPMIFRTSDTERMRIHSNGGLKFNPQSAAPTAEAGTVYYDSDDNKLKVYNGTSWVDLH